MATLLVSLVGLTVTSAPALADTGCPAAGCSGAFPADTKCDTDPNKFPFATALITWQMQVQNSRISLVYSPLCDTYWGQVDGLYTGYTEAVMLFGQDQYGGRDRLIYSQSSTNNSLSTIQTKMTAAGPGSVKFCASTGSFTDDPDLTPADEQGSSPSANCTAWR